MSLLIESEVVAAWLNAVLADATLTDLLPGGVHETDVVSEGITKSPGKTAPRQETPCLIFSMLASPGDTQGAGGTVLVGDVEYAVQVFYRPSETASARAALRRVQTLLEGVEFEAEATDDIDAHAITSRSMGSLPRLADREVGRLVYSEGRRWRFRVSRI